MTEKRRVTATTSTHSTDEPKQGDSEFGVQNSQSGDAQLLIDPEESTNVSTHSQDTPTAPGPKKVPTTAAIVDQELDGPVKTAEIDPEVDPADGYLEQDDSLPVVEVPAAVEDAGDVPGGEVATDPTSDDDFLAEDDDVEAEFDDEFADLPTLETDSSGDDGVEDDGLDQEPVDEPFEAPADESETVALVDADETPDGIDGEDDLQFATVANVVHVLRANRIIASMGAGSAKRAQVGDVYLSPQFQDVVASTVVSKGLRKGLVQSGFVLARVKLAAASKATTKAVQAKVTASIAKQVALVTAREKAMEQSLAIAAVGINRRFFKDTTNELKANLETELVQLGVRGGQTLVRSAFAQHGVSYAKSILTLAKKIAAMPQEMRDSYVDALDMTDGDEGDELVDDTDTEFDNDGGDQAEDEFAELPASTVTAALSHNSQPRRNNGVLLSAGVKTTAALNILNGSQSLV